MQCLGLSVGLLFSLVSWWEQMEIQEIPFNHKKKTFFTVKVVTKWNRLHREVVAVPSLEVLKTQLGTALGNLL